MQIHSPTWNIHNSIIGRQKNLGQIALLTKLT